MLDWECECVYVGLGLHSSDCTAKFKILHQNTVHKLSFPEFLLLQSGDLKKISNICTTYTHKYAFTTM
jgi:hypothetical protein